MDTRQSVTGRTFQVTGPATKWRSTSDGHETYRHQQRQSWHCTFRVEQQSSHRYVGAKCNAIPTQRSSMLSAGEEREPMKDLPHVLGNMAELRDAANEMCQRVQNPILQRRPWICQVKVSSWSKITLRNSRARASMSIWLAAGKCLTE